MKENFTVFPSPTSFAVAMRMRDTLASYSFASDGKDFSRSTPLANMEAMKPFLLIGLLVGSLNAAPKGWPNAVLEIKYPSKADNSKQPALYYKPLEIASP